MELYRIAKRPYSDVLSGRGAAKFGNRWNSKGVEIIYTASNRSLAMAEVLVHLPFHLLPNDYVMLTIYVPDFISQKIITTDELSTNWNHFPSPPNLKRIGDDFIGENKYGLLKVPSAVTHGDYNLLINPFFKDFSKIVIIDKVPFLFDNRFFDNK